jgi:hypothetical protein
MLDKLDEYADKMPQPEFIELANNLINSFFLLKSAIYNNKLAVGFRKLVKL